jgi:predicted CXXCH cytochrome family protein
MELVLLLATATGTLLPLLALARPRRMAMAAAVVALAVVWVAGVWWHERAHTREALAAVRTAELPHTRSDGGYVSSAACATCHPDAYATWHATYHRTMTQPASPETVLAPFDGVRLASGDVAYRLERRGDEFWIVDERSPEPARRVVMVTGSHQQQRYWMRGRSTNGLDLFAFAYLLGEKRWVPGETIFVIPPTITAIKGTDLWNANCVGCHAVAGQPGIVPGNEAVETRAGELGIACEGCHGPGADHVRANSDPLRRYARHLAPDAPDPTIVNPRRLSAAKASQVCGQCHGVSRQHDLPAWRRDGARFRPGGTLDDDRWVIRYEHDPPEPWKRAISPIGVAYMDEHFWPDGTIRVSGREYNGLIESRCAQKGDLSCLSCHAMHGDDPDDQLRADRNGDGACSPCHDDVRTRIADHTHHRSDGEGSRCQNCHMPYTTFGLLKAIRSHRIDSPRVTAEGAAGRPNACNLCHLDRTLGWTASHLEEWWGTPAPVLGDDEQRVAASLLWLLRGDAGERVIAAWSMGWAPAQAAAGSGWEAPFIAELLDDPYAAVRFEADRALRTLPGFADLGYDYVGPRAEWTEARRQTMAMWRESGQHGDAILLDANGVVDHGAVAALRARRDDRPVFLAE